MKFLLGPVKRQPTLPDHLKLVSWIWKFTSHHQVFLLEKKWNCKVFNFFFIFKQFRVCYFSMLYLFFKLKWIFEQCPSITSSYADACVSPPLQNVPVFRLQKLSTSKIRQTLDLVLAPSKVCTRGWWAKKPHEKFKPSLAGQGVCFKHCMMKCSFNVQTYVRTLENITFF